MKKAYLTSLLVLLLITVLLYSVLLSVRGTETLFVIYGDEAIVTHRIHFGIAGVLITLQWFTTEPFLRNRLEI